MSNPKRKGLMEIAAQLCSLNSGASMMDEAEAHLLLSNVAEVHGLDRGTRYWWTSVSNAEVLTYGDDFSAWQKAVSGIVASFGAGVMYLAITDDEAEPWPTLKCEDPLAMIGALGDLHFFEYFIFSEDGSKICFDTHGNTLVTSVR